MSNLEPELGDVEDEVGARLSNLMGNLVRAVGEHRTQNAPVSLEMSVIPLPVWAGIGQYCNVFFYPLLDAGLRPGSVTTHGGATCTCHPINT